MSDQDIIGLLKSQQNHKAFVKLYKYENVVKKHVLSQHGTKQDAQDIFQEALIILHRKANIEAFELTSSLNTLIFGISKNLWRDQLRKKKTILQENNNTIADTIEFDLSIEQEKKFRLAENALENIAEQCKKLLELFYIKKESMISIANLLGMSSENAAKTQKYKCLEKARENYVQLLSNQ